MSPYYAFLSGMLMTGALVCGLFFLRFWRKTGDRLFLIFASAFGVMSLERILLIITTKDVESDDNVLVLLLRIIAFAMIYYAIWDKNRPSSRR
jgi:hypothetical protein